MTYNIFGGTNPTMFNPAKGTKFCKILLSKASKDAHETLFLW